jgi:hypothetical protein
MRVLPRGIDAVRPKPMLDERDLPLVVDVQAAPLLDGMDASTHPPLREQSVFQALEAMRPDDGESGHDEIACPHVIEDRAAGAQMKSLVLHGAQTAGQSG